MSNVVSIEERRPHLAGPCFCVECGHKWVLVAPVGTHVLECPGCGGRKGARMNMVKKDEPHWTCDCGNSLFFATDDGFYCPNCGVDQVLPK